MNLLSLSANNADADPITDISTNAATSKRHPSIKPIAPGIKRINSDSSYPSPTSTCSSSGSFFDSPGFDDADFKVDRRQSAESSTSWGSMNTTVSKKPPDDDEQDMEASQRSTPPQQSSTITPITSNNLSDTVSSSSSSVDHDIATPDLDPISTPYSQFPHIISSFPSNPNASPSSSTTSTAPSKGENTPRAELPPPVWPLSTSTPRANDVCAEPASMPSSDNQPDVPMVTVSRNSSLKRNGSWRRKHASLDTPPTAPHLDPTFPSFTSLRHTPPIINPTPFGQKAAWPNPAHPDFKRLSSDSGKATSNASRIVAESPSTGCFISAPIQPPAGYPLPSLHTNLRRDLLPSGSAVLSPSPSSASTKSSSSRKSKSKSKSPTPLPPPPKWAQPPAKANSISGRALSFGSSQDRPDVNFDDFDPELLEGAEDEWIEIMKGAEGRIAIKSTPAIYDIMVWLPGFSLDNITIATRGHRTIHIVADQWDEGDHAQWDIKLGEDANLKSVNAKFTGKELRVTVAREQRPVFRSNASYRSGSTMSSSRSGNGSYTSPSITATVGHNLLDQTTSDNGIARGRSN